MKHTIQKSSGFSLIEIMIAVAILSMVIGAIYSTWSAILRASKTIRVVANATQRERVAVQLIEDALMGAQLYEANGQWYAFLAENGPNAILSFVSKLPESFPRSGRFGDLRLRRVIFALEQGLNGKPQLTLRQIPLLMEIDRDEEEHPLILLPNVREFYFTFWDSQRGTWIDEWKATNRLPEIVLVSIVVSGEETTPGVAPPTRQLIRIVNLPCRGVPAAVQTRQPGPLRPPAPTLPTPGESPGTQPGIQIPPPAIPVPKSP